MKTTNTNHSVLNLHPTRNLSSHDLPCSIADSTVPSPHSRNPASISSRQLNSSSSLACKQPRKTRMISTSGTLKNTWSSCQKFLASLELDDSNLSVTSSSQGKRMPAQLRSRTLILLCTIGRQAISSPSPRSKPRSRLLGPRKCLEALSALK